MSTVPKLTYAKVGKGSKNKIESASSQLLRSKQEKSDDLFSYMNQQNLNYIKKELKMKKNRSEHQRPRSPEREEVELSEQKEQEAIQRHKLYQKYRREEEVSEKEPHLEDTQRRSEGDRPIEIVLPEQIDEDEDIPHKGSSRNQMGDKHFISSSHRGVRQVKNNEGDIGYQRSLTGNLQVQNKMYHSLPYEDGKQRISSIQGYFGEAISTNLNRQEGLFIQFLEEYISDLNHSKRLKSREQEQPSAQKNNEGYLSQRKGTASREGSQPRNVNKVDFDLKQNLKKLKHLNHNSDTFGEPNSKFTLKSNRSHSDQQRQFSELQQRLKQEKLNSLILAQQVQKQRKLLDVKDQIIKKLQIDNDLLKEQIRHVKIQQQIINKRKISIPHFDYSSEYGQQNKARRYGNEENQQKMAQVGKTMPINERHTSVNPQKAGQSYRNSFKNEDNLFQLFAGSNYNNGSNDRPKRGKIERGSLQKWEKQYHQFLQQQKSSHRFTRGGRKGNDIRR